MFLVADRDEVDSSITISTLKVITKCAMSTINVLANEKSDILYTPTDMDSLESNHMVIRSIIGNSIKNKLLKN